MSPDWLCTIPGYDVSGCNLPGPDPTHEVDSLRLSEDEVAVWAMNGSGSVRRRIREAMPSVLRATREPGRVLQELNRGADLGLGGPLEFAEMMVMVLDHACHRYRAAAAGDFVPLVKQKDEEWSQFGRMLGGCPLGMIEGEDFETREVTLRPGAAVFWFSPYSTQITSATHGLYTRRRIINRLTLEPLSDVGMIEAILRDMRSFAGERPWSEDICLLWLHHRDGALRELLL